MASKGQSLRPSQYITTFGPGSILETPDGPVVIASPGQSTLFDNNSPDDYEIRDIRLSETLLGGNKIFSVPSNADLGLPENTIVYRTFHFPKWSLCTQHGILYFFPRYGPKKGCPRCNNIADAGVAWRKAREEAVRFVVACPHGHLDEVPWRYLMRHSPSCQGSSYYQWRGGGGALRNIEITCPECGGSTNFGQAYSRSFSCRGKSPEDGSETTCQEDAKIIQRGASNLRVSELRSALTIPPLDTALHRLLQSRSILAVLPEDFESKEQFMRELDKLVRRRLMDQTTVETIRGYAEQEIARAVEDVLDEQTKPRNLTEASLRTEEFHSLCRAARYGAPPERADKPGGPNQFEVYIENIRTIQLKSGRFLRVTPLSRLRVVMAQIGYTRPISNSPDEPHLVSVDYRPSNDSLAWHPGIELFGEGIFLDLTQSTQESAETVNQHFDFVSGAKDSWMKAFQADKGYKKIRSMPGVEREYLHPVFVWWHTLSHRLINALSVDSGYSSSAIRERVYIVQEEGQVRGGLLLYTAQSGGDGTLGGLIGLVPHFERILEVALRNIDACSNDPICIEDNFDNERVNGSACYACQLVSETSCEHRNTLLDRRLLLENLP